MAKINVFTSRRRRSRPKKTAQGAGKFTKWPSNPRSKKYKKKKYRGQGGRKR